MWTPRDMLDEFPPFRACWPWLGPDLQSIAHKWTSHGTGLDGVGETVEIAVRDGRGDRLAHHLHRAPGERRSRRPLVVLYHGMGGSAESTYVIGAATHFIRRGFSVLRYNRRGCGIGRDLAAGCAWHGDTIGLTDTVRVLQHRYTEVVSGGVAFVGFSLGANTFVQWLADDAEDVGARPAILGAVTISVPIDLAESAAAIDSWRNACYRPYIMWKLRHEILRPTAALSEAQRAAVRKARGMWEFARDFNAPRLGFDSVETYYEEGNLVRRLASLHTPILILHAMDDPWVPHHAYGRVDWDGNPNLVPLFPARGGHLGFEDGCGNAPWSVRCASLFIERCVAESAAARLGSAGLEEASIRPTDADSSPNR